MFSELRLWVVPIMVVSISSWTLWLTNKKGNLSSFEHADAMRKQEENGQKIDKLDGKIDIFGVQLGGHLGWHEGQHDANLEHDRRRAAIIVSETAAETARVLKSA